MGMEKSDSDGLKRCPWCGSDALYIKYHDEEWGRPQTDDRKLFELLILEGAQAGLSWITILRKRENYRKAFFDFDFLKVAEMSHADEERLMQDEGIVRNRLKIHAATVNARHFREVVDEFGSFHAYVMTFFPGGKRLVNNIPDMKDVPVTSSISDALSKDLRKRGFKFVGPTVCYSFLQAAGFVDDHLNDCAFKGEQRISPPCPRIP